MKTCVYPGSFDPVTAGHMDIIERSVRLFDKVTVAVLNNVQKMPLFTLEEKLSLLRESVAHLENVEVDSFSGLLMDYMRHKGQTVVVRGLRAISDFEHEFSMAAMNARIAPEIETVFMMTRTEYSFLSSSMVKDLVINGGNIAGLVPQPVEHRIADMIRRRCGGKTMKLYELLAELREEIQMSPAVLLSRKKAVDLDIILEILEDINEALPEDLREAREIIEEKNKILAEAQEEAQSILQDAESRLNALVEESEVTLKAHEKAREITDTAQKNAKEIRLGAKEYADDILADIEGYLHDYTETVKKNRLELNAQKK